jgi:GWxTD domain-containing protein
LRREIFDLLKMKIIITIVLTALIFNISSAQEKKNNDMFYLDVLNFFSPDSTKTRLDVYAEIPFSKVEFRRDRNSNNFVSDVDFTLNIRDKYNNSVFDKVYKEEITTPKTDIEYLASNSQIIIKNFFLEPGEYRVKVSVYELSTKRQAEKEVNATVKDFLKDPLSISDIMIVSKLNEVNGRKYITPSASRNVTDLDTFYLFFFVYKNSEQPSVDVNCKISDLKGEQLFSRNESIDITSGIDIENRLFVAVPTAKFSFGKYKIDVTASTTQYTAEQKADLDNENLEFPVDLTNIDDAISQLQYIAKDDELDHIKDGKTDVEKRKRFIEFWDSKDPSPSTRRNEVMIEYYKRIKYADKHFSTAYTEGWRTDMGMVYIIFGMPNNIERHPYEMGTKPYEIWEYYELNRQFVFVDDTGFGDYRLITPIWDRFNYR